LFLVLFSSSLSQEFPMSHYNLALLGFGNVGRALARLLQRKEAELQSRYDITFRVTGIATGRHGAAVNPAGLDYIHAASLAEAGESLAALSKTPISSNSEFLRACAADVMFENTPVNHATGQPAIDHLHLALELGMHAITANKGPVVHAYRELSEFAKTRHKRFYFESTVMDGAPIFSLFRSSLPAAQLLGFRGILNSTTNLILGRMESGESFEDAVKYAQSVGLAETDPAADVDGWDASIKVAALINVLMEIRHSWNHAGNGRRCKGAGETLEAGLLGGTCWRIGHRPGCPGTSASFFHTIQCGRLLVHR
jgi:homoserine dehydrogenase